MSRYHLGNRIRWNPSVAESGFSVRVDLLLSFPSCSLARRWVLERLGIENVSSATGGNEKNGGGVLPGESLKGEVRQLDLLLNADHDGV